MAEEKPVKRKLADIVRTDIVKKTAPKPREENKFEERIEEKLEEFDEKVEKFEKEEIKRFKAEDAFVKTKKRHFGIGLKSLILALIILMLTGGAVYSAMTFLPRAEIKIIAKKSGWDYVDSVNVSKSAAAIDAAAKQMPGEIFSLKKNLTLSFPATGKQQVEKKAKGKITIYNAFSSDSQILVAGTRFAAPDGKMLKLDAKITVPGAKISEGKIVPSSIEAAVTAEKPGIEYNIGPISRLTIPGFQGSAKYQGFYGELKDQLAGGFVGELAVPTEADIKQGREKTVQAVKDSIDAFLLAQIPAEFKIVEEAKQFAVVKENIGKEAPKESELPTGQADANGNFLVFIEGETSIFGFKESDLLNMLNVLAKNDLGDDFEIKSFQIEYGVARTDFAAGKMSFPINFKGVFWQPINIEKVKQLMTGKKESELRAMIFSLAGVEKANISLWPFWVKTVSGNLNRIKVEVE